MSDPSAIPAARILTVTSVAWLIAALSVVMVAPLLSTPRAVFTTNQPWKVELLSSLFLLVLIAWSFARNKERLAGSFLPADKSSRTILALLLAFGIWSGISLIWAGSAGLAVHHTLSWSIYLIYLVVLLGLLRMGRGVSIITGSFTLIALILGVLCLIDYMGMVDFSYAEGTIRIRYAKFAELLITLSPLLWMTTLYVRGRRRFFLLMLAATLSWVAVMLSLSKGAFLSGIIGFLILFAGCAFFSIRRIRKRVIVMAAVWLAITIGTQILFSTVSSIPSTTDYISGSADKTRSTATMRVFTWSVARHMAASHWLIGVGADNFGIAFNAARADLAAKHPAASREEIAEDYMVERAHNEFLQILAELGIVGLLLFAGAFGYFAYLTTKSFCRNKYRLSPVFWAALAGMAAFFVSSLFSSFSFRAVQNGLVFFLVFAVAVNELSKMSTNRMIERQDVPGPVRNRMAVALAVGFAAITVIFSGTRAAAELYVYRAERASRTDNYESDFRKALQFDRDDAPAYLSFGLRIAGDGHYDRSAALLRDAIDRGLGVTLTYSLLAKYQGLAGDDTAADKTFEEAIAVFPRSVFMRVRYAVFLDDHGRTSDAEKQMEFARGIDLKQANGWHSIIKDGSVAAFYKAQNDPETAFPADLRPENAVSQYLDSTGIFDTNQNGPDSAK